MFTPIDYSITVSVFIRLLGLIYFFAFGAFILQIKGLLGENGILPACKFLKRLRSYRLNKRVRYFPSVFWISCSDTALLSVVWAGTVMGLLLAAGIFPPLMLFALFVLYLSIITVGQEFLGFGWEGFLLEITVHAFLLSLTTVPNMMVWLSVNFLLFRFHFQAGAVKLQSNDPSWWNLTALACHYETQPIPNATAWYVHKLPLKFHQFSTALMFFIELVVPFGIFMTEEVRLGVFACFFLLQLMIWLTGNFSFLNHLTAIFSIILVSNPYLEWAMSVPTASPPPSIFLTIFLSAAGFTLLGLQIFRLWVSFTYSPTFKKILNGIAPYHLANRYGIFAVMTTKRYEIIIEGSSDGIEWKEYLFKHKPSEPERRPRRISPYQPRLDWQVWFSPFTDFKSEVWLQRFMWHLLGGTSDVLKLLRVNPFTEGPPRYIRAHLYLYEFSSWEEKRATGLWWHRTYVCPYSPVMELKQK